MAMVFILVYFFNMNILVVLSSRLTGSIYKTLNDIGKHDCISECIHSTTCMSFNFDKIHYRCEISFLNQSTSPAEKFQVNVDYVYGDKLDFLSKKDDACKDVNCPYKQKCVKLHTGTSKCVITECGEPPVISNGFIAGNISISPVGKTYNFQCSNGYQISGNSAVICKANGDWSTVNAQCIVACDTNNGYTYNVANNMCFKLYSTSKTWMLANTACEVEGTVLIKLDTAAKREIIKAAISTSSTYYHIGAMDIGHPGTFTWMDGTTVTGVPWEGTEPDSSATDNGLDVVIKNGYLLFYDDHVHSYQNGYICEKILP